MSDHVHSRQPFHNRNEDPHRSNSRPQRDQPRKNFDDYGKRDDRRDHRDRRDDYRREQDDRRELRDRRDDRDHRDRDNDEGSRGLKSQTRRRPPPASPEGVGLASSPPEDVLWEDQSIHSTTGARMRPPSPESREKLVATNKVDSDVVKDIMDPKKRKSLTIHGEFDMDKWIMLAEMGELDVYTCLGLSDVCTWTVDTQSLVFYVITSLLLQCLIPACMLYLQLQDGLHGSESAATSWSTTASGSTTTWLVDSTTTTWLSTMVSTVDSSDEWARLTDHLKPMKAGVAFRGIGFVMFLYSLYSMYNAAVDECRCVLLHFCLKERVRCGIWWPLLLGEVANFLVGIVLMCTLYFMFVQTSDGSYLVLNAVAINFLADVDHQFVDREIYMAASDNFRSLMHTYLGNGSQDIAFWARALQAAMSSGMALFIFVGVVLAFAFLLAPCRDGGTWYGGLS